MEVRKLDPKIRIKMLLPVLIIVFVIVLASAILGSLKILNVPPFYIALLCLLILIPAIIYVEIYYRRFEVHIEKDKIIVKKGIVLRKNIMIPFDKIQDVTIEKNIVEHLLGIGIVKIETAGTNPLESEGIIDGISNYREFASMLIEASRAERAESEIERMDGISLLAQEMEMLREEIRKLNESIKKMKK
ncbi:MAG: PH domain-containing protein [Candidatus Anstonellales archaeon]